MEDDEYYSDPEEFQDDEDPNVLNDIKSDGATSGSDVDTDSEGEDMDEDEPDVEKIDSHHLNIEVNQLTYTTDSMNMFEYCLLVGMRAQEIERGAPTYIDPIAEGLTEPLAIAESEMAQRKFPLWLRRPIGTKKNGALEYEDVNPNLIDLPLGVGIPKQV
jgi:DNA-directed RNA polymerase subunit K/omega